MRLTMLYHIPEKHARAIECKAVATPGSAGTSSEKIDISED
jgi:hypothetical protein